MINNQKNLTLGNHNWDTHQKTVNYLMILTLMLTDENAITSTMNGVDSVFKLYRENELLIFTITTDEGVAHKVVLNVLNDTK